MNELLASLAHFIDPVNVTIIIVFITAISIAELAKRRSK